MSSWVNRKEVNSSDIMRLAKGYNITPMMSAILLKRDIDDFYKFLNPSTLYMKDPLLLKDMKKGCDLISNAIKNGEKIAIINDYDVDGITSGQIMFEVIELLSGKEPVILPPNRIIDGYGMSKRLVDVAKENGCTFIITTDNGISACESIDYAKSLGFTVVITDHHEVPYELLDNGKKNYILPNADAIINPKQADCPYPFKEICGASVAYKVASVLLDIFNLDKNTKTKYCRKWGELMSLGTVCDVMPLVDENRMYVSAGIKLIRNGSSYIAIRQLLDVLNIEPSIFSAYHFGFSVGPCLNAVGRLTGSVDECMAFLNEKDQRKAKEMAEWIVSCNDERKDVCEDIVALGKELIDKEGEKNIYILYIPSVLDSVCGIVAGKLKEYINKPVIVCSDTEEGYLKGSGRSIKGFNLFSFILRHKSLFIKAGGHELAVGLSVTKENFNIVKAKFEEDSNIFVPSEVFDNAKCKVVDLFVSMANIPEDFVKECIQLEPFGNGNPKPVLCDENVLVHSAKIIGKNGNTLKLSLISKGRRVDAICFNNIEKFTEMVENTYGEQELNKLFHTSSDKVYLDFLYCPSFNTWNGITSIQYIITDFRVKESD